VGNIHDTPAQKINGSDPNLTNPQQITFLPHSVNCNSSSHLKYHIPSTSKRQPPSLNQLSSLEEQKLNMFRELISNLSCIRRLEDVKDNKLIFSFRSCKYKAKLANKTLSILNRYLSKHGHVLLIQILHLWFTIDLYDLHDDLYNDYDSSSSSSSSEHNNVHNLDINKQRNNSRIDRLLNDSLNCDTQKDIRYIANNSRYNYERPTTANQCDDNSTNFYGNGNNTGSSNNVKLKRLRECLHRINNKFHKPVRIFNINYTENR
jgi:WD40 associated region in TFIID subunit, NTD2 domain